MSASGTVLGAVLRTKDRPKSIPGVPPCPIRTARMMEFGLRYVKPEKDVPDALLAQLSYCLSDEARRIILGVSK